MEAHIISGVVMDIAAFKVSHSIECDIDATALRAVRARSSSIGALWMKVQGMFKTQASTPEPCAHTRHRVNHSTGQWRKCLGRFKMQTLTYCDATFMSTRTAAGQFKGQFKGAGTLRMGDG